MLILIEGCDRMGKSTQVKMLVDHLRDKGMRVEKKAYPNRTTPIGQVINRVLSKEITMEKHALQLLFTANRFEGQTEIDELFKEGVIVVLDRYVPSAVAYGAADGLDATWLWTVNRQLMIPDVGFFLDMPLEIASKRGGFGAERYETIDFQRRIQKNFQELVQEPGQNYCEWFTVNADQSPDAIHKEICSMLHAYNSSFPLP